MESYLMLYIWWGLQLPAAFSPDKADAALKNSFLFSKTKLSKIIYSFALHPIFFHLLIRDANVDK